MAKIPFNDGKKNYGDRSSPEPFKKGRWFVGFAVVAVLVVLFLLSGCGSDGPEVPTEGNPSSIDVRWIDLGDGQEVRCVIYHDGYKGGVSCDWEHMRGRS